ncbi:MAG: two-component sensor histidine kinase, partial [Lachnospiraceae bacterium]|nr:two-component sensor histidine kinase [Lachnospiraceae bacterium]
NVSHELKTPLTSISGYAELIATGMASKKEGRHFAEEIHQNAQRLLVLINDILQLSQLDDTPEQQFTFEPVDLYELAARCMEMMEPVAARHGVQLSLKGTPLMIYADGALIEELLYNLCDNAIRYNQKDGHVWMTVTDCLIIQDDGIGIPPEYQKRVFERFFRVDKSRSRKTGGTGLGLAIVKHIAQVHGAVISLDSDEGIGTTVRVKFPNVPRPIP